MTNGQAIALFVVWLGFIGLFWWRRQQYKKRLATTGRAAQYERARVKMVRVFYPLLGVALIGLTLWEWPTLTPDNKPVALFAAAAGVAALIYGLSQWRN